MLFGNNGSLLSDQRVYDGKSRPNSRPISRKLSIASGLHGYESDDSESLSNESGYEDLFEIEKKRLH